MPNKPCQFQHGGSLYGSHRFPLVIAHTVITWRSFIKGERLFFVFSQRRVTDTADSTANARGLKNLSANDLANSFPVFLLTNQRVNIWDHRDSLALDFK